MCEKTNNNKAFIDVIAVICYSSLETLLSPDFLFHSLLADPITTGIKGDFLFSLLSFWPSRHISDDGPHTTTKTTEATTAPCNAILLVGGERNFLFKRKTSWNVSLFGSLFIWKWFQIEIYIGSFFHCIYFFQLLDGNKWLTICLFFHLCFFFQQGRPVWNHFLELLRTQRTRSINCLIDLFSPFVRFSVEWFRLFFFSLTFVLTLFLYLIKWRDIGEKLAYARLSCFEGKQEMVDKTSNEYRNGSIDATKTINLFSTHAVHRRNVRIAADALRLENKGKDKWVRHCIYQSWNLTRLADGNEKKNGRTTITE